LKTQFIFCTIALAAMMGCAKRPPAVDFEKDFLQEKAKYEPNIGKTYWLLGSRFLCPTSTTNVIDCTSIPPGTKLQLNGIERGITSDAYYHVTLEDGRTGYVSRSTWSGLERTLTRRRPRRTASGAANLVLA